jgi:hypothetical protein
MLLKEYFKKVLQNGLNDFKFGKDLTLKWFMQNENYYRSYVRLRLKEKIFRDAIIC